MLPQEVLAGQNAALLMPGETVVLEAGLPGVGRFVSAFEAQYGAAPSPEAAQGYNAARRIDLAVRSAGSASDLGALAQSFSLSAAGIDW